MLTVPKMDLQFLLFFDERRPMYCAFLSTFERIFKSTSGVPHFVGDVVSVIFVILKSHNVTSQQPIRAKY